MLPSELRGFSNCTRFRYAAFTISYIIWPKLMGSKIPRKPPVKEVGRKRPLSDVIDVNMDEPVTSDKLSKPISLVLRRLFERS